MRYLLPLKTVIKPNGHKAYVLFSNVVQVIPREQVGIGRRKREVPVDEPDDLCPLHASGRRTHESLHHRFAVCSSGDNSNRKSSFWRLVGICVFPCPTGASRSCLPSEVFTPITSPSGVGSNGMPQKW